MADPWAPTFPSLSLLLHTNSKVTILQGLTLYSFFLLTFSLRTVASLEMISWKRVRWEVKVPLIANFHSF
jgi:hypothetical protein